ncbi:MAG: hypothetical protein ACJAVI_004237 [Candidatus Azotimanducaceae bacterium]|jgi:hypothetical protein
MRSTHRRRNAEKLTVLNDLIDSARIHVPIYQAYRRLNKTYSERPFLIGWFNSTMNWVKLYQVATSGTTDRVMTFQDDNKHDWDGVADLYVKYTTEFRGKVLKIPPDNY